jgi:polyhydroxyalkanoate synthesis repressor PhaR
MLDRNDALRYIGGVKEKDARAGERLIRRYENRKLYDPAAKRYVTLPDLATMIGHGEEVRVVDQKTGEDLTTMVLAQVIQEGLKEKTASIPRQVLTRLIRLGWGPVKAWAEWTGPQEVAQRTKAEAERIASNLMSRGRLTLEEALALRQEITGSVSGLVGEAQRGFEERVHRLLEKTEQEGGVAPSLKGLKERLLAFETYLGAPKKGAPGARPRRSRKRTGRTGKPAPVKK